MDEGLIFAIMESGEEVPPQCFMRMRVQIPFSSWIM